MAKRKRLTPARPEMFAKDGTGPAAPGHDMDILRLNPDPASEPAPRRGGTPPIADMAGAAAAEAAAAEMAETLRAAREEGRLVLSLPRADIDTAYMMRDRITVDEGEMTTLVESIRARGQQTPIEVVALEDGGYGLISGWRRMQALERLAQETGDAQFDTVQALMRRPEQSADAYVAMVEENEIRVGLSYYERARIAARAVDAKIFVSEKGALLRLFHAASRTKRSKIRSFLTVVHALDGYLMFPETLPERLGLDLARRLDADEALGGELRAMLSQLDPGSAAEEQAAITTVLKAGKAAAPSPAPAPAASGDELVPGLHLKSHRNGSLTLSGPGLDAALRQKLLDWLKSQG